MINLFLKKKIDKDRPDYYISPFHNFTQYTKDCELSQLKNEMEMVRQKLGSTKKQYAGENKRLTLLIKEKFLAIEEQVLAELRATLQLVRNTLKAGSLPEEVKELSWIKELIFKRQVRGLKDNANHALVVEQSAIAPLTVGIIHYKRHREIQEALTTFVNDEAKHSATFRRFLVEKLAAKELISDNLIQGADRFMWVARYVPSAGLFLAVIIEAIGAATLEFFAKEEYMPDRLFRSICDTISIQDERRHMDLCVAMYNELFRKGTKIEQVRNEFSLRTIMKAVYGDKTEDHPLIEAFRAFGVDSQVLYDHVAGRLSQQLARVGLYVKPERILGYIGK